MRRLPAFAILLLLLSPGAQALRVTGGFDLGPVDPGSTFLMRVVLDNTVNDTAFRGDYETSVVVPQAYTEEDEALIPSWLAPQGQTWAVEAHANSTFDLQLAIPAEAHSGPYQLLANFLERQNTRPGGQVVAVAINHAVTIAFVVQGVDLLGRVALPQVAKPESVYPRISLAVGNYLGTEIAGSPVQELWLAGERMRTFDLEDQAIPSAPSNPLTTFSYEPDFRGLPIGEYLVRTFVRYGVAGEEGFEESRAKEQPLVIGEEELTFTGHAINASVGRFAAPEGSRLRLPRGIDPVLELNVANVGHLLSVADLTLSVQRRGGEEQGTAHTVTVPRGAVRSAALAFQLPSEGIYDLQLREEGNAIWNATIEALSPTMGTLDARLRRDAILVTFPNQGVIVRVCYVVDVRTPFGQIVEASAPLHDCRTLDTNENWMVDRPLDVADLPEGPYAARFEAKWTGGGEPIVSELPFRLPIDSPIDLGLLLLLAGVVALCGSMAYAYRVSKPRRGRGPPETSARKDQELERKDQELRAREAELERRERELEEREQRQ